MATLQIFFFGFLFLCIVANNLTLGRMANGHKPQPPVPSYPAAAGPTDPGPGNWNADYAWMHTPSRRRMQYAVAEGTDTEADPPPFKAIMQTPSLRRSPSKGDRPRSHAKYGRSPSKGY